MTVRSTVPFRLWLLIGLMAMLVACGSDGVPNVVTVASEGRLVGLVIGPDGLPLAGVPVVVQPPSLISPGAVETAVDGRFVVRAPVGPILVLVGGGATTTTETTVTVVSNQTTDAGVLTVAPQAVPVLAGNAPPTITAAEVTPMTLASGGAITVTATVTDPDSAPDQLAVSAAAVGRDGFLAVTPLTLTGDRYEGRLTLTNPSATELGLTISVAVSDAASGRTVTRSGLLVVVAAP